MGNLKAYRIVLGKYLDMMQTKYMSKYESHSLETIRIIKFFLTTIS